MPESQSADASPADTKVQSQRHGGEAAVEPGLSRQDLALLAHELRGALTAILSLSELTRRHSAQAQWQGGDEEAVHSALDGIARAVARADALIGDAQGGLVRASRPDRIIHLARLAETAARDARAISGREVRVAALRAPQIEGDENALARALANLIDNALKYSLGSSPVEVGVGVTDDTAVLSVADRGPGIPPDERERVLMPFERLDHHAKLPGSGLGLAVVTQVAENHGGHVTIEDRAGGGAVVALHLPVTSAR